jgi:hypothetical protein
MASDNSDEHCASCGKRITTKWEWGGEVYCRDDYLKAKRESIGEQSSLSGFGVSGQTKAADFKTDDGGDDEVDT